MFHAPSSNQLLKITASIKWTVVYWTKLHHISDKITQKHSRLLTTYKIVLNANFLNACMHSRLNRYKINQICFSRCNKLVLVDTNRCHVDCLFVFENRHMPSSYEHTRIFTTNILMCLCALWLNLAINSSLFKLFLLSNVYILQMFVGEEKKYHLWFLK